MSMRPPVNLIREQCDGELSPEQADQLQSHLRQNPEQARHAADMLEFERSLRQRVGKLMGQPTGAPWELKNQIRMAMQQDHVDARPQAANESRRW
jgi:anti-sigma factor RsiW